MSNNEKLQFINIGCHPEPPAHIESFVLELADVFPDWPASPPSGLPVFFIGQEPMKQYDAPPFEYRTFLEKLLEDLDDLTDEDDWIEVPTDFDEPNHCDQNHVEFSDPPIWGDDDELAPGPPPEIPPKTKPEKVSLGLGEIRRRLRKLHEQIKEGAHGGCGAIPFGNPGSEAFGFYSRNACNGFLAGKQVVGVCPQRIEKTCRTAEEFQFLLATVVAREFGRAIMDRNNQTEEYGKRDDFFLWMEGSMANWFALEMIGKLCWNLDLGRCNLPHRQARDFLRFAENFIRGQKPNFALGYHLHKLDLPDRYEFGRLFEAWIHSRNRLGNAEWKKSKSKWLGYMTARMQDLDPGIVAGLYCELFEPLMGSCLEERFLNLEDEMRFLARQSPAFVAVWRRIGEHQGQVFTSSGGRKFTYAIDENENLVRTEINRDRTISSPKVEVRHLHRLYVLRHAGVCRSHIAVTGQIMKKVFRDPVFVWSILSDERMDLENS